MSLQPAGVEGLEDRVGVELVIHRNKDEEELAGGRFRKDPGQCLAVVLELGHLVKLCSKVPEAVPQ